MIWNIFVAVAALIVSQEMEDWIPEICLIILEKAASNIPLGERESYLEERLSHIAGTPGKIGKLIHSIDILARDSYEHKRIAERRKKKEEEEEFKMWVAKDFLSILSDDIQIMRTEYGLMRYDVRDIFLRHYLASFASEADLTSLKGCWLQSRRQERDSNLRQTSLEMAMKIFRRSRKLKN